MLSFILALFLLVLFPVGWQSERAVKATLTRTVAGALPIDGRRLVAVAIPYRPNRVYVRLAVI